MRIFLSSTSHDLQDLRDLTVARLRDMGHEPIYFESPAFPVHLHLHSQDQCIVSVEGCDLLICVVDRRYGGKYVGALRDRFSAQEVNIRGSKVGKAIQIGDLSATWCEVLEAHRLGIPVMTFARERVMNEKETRRRNGRVKRFHTAFVDNELVFDFLDWITQRKLYNWITQFRTIVDYDEKLQKWVSSYDNARVAAAPGPPEGTRTNPSGLSVVPSPVEELVVFCEGQTDAAIIHDIVSRLSLPAPVTILPTFGKMSALKNISTVVPDLLKLNKGVLFVLDGDTWDPDEERAQYQQFRERVQSTLGSSAVSRVHLVLATMAIETWVLAGLDKSDYDNAAKDRASFRDLKRFVKISGVDIHHGLPVAWDLDRARNTVGSLGLLVEKLQFLTGKIRMA